MTDRLITERLAQCDPDAVPRFIAALGHAIAYGADAYIERNPWRTAEQQRAKKEAGLSDTLDSAHCHTRIRTNPHPGPVVEIPASRAIHLISRQHFYFALAPALLPAFAVRVGAAFLKERLTWGGLYGPRRRPDETRDQYVDRIADFDMLEPVFRRACVEERWKEAETLFEVAQAAGAAWDPLHGEWRPA